MKNTVVDADELKKNTIAAANRHLNPCFAWSANFQTDNLVAVEAEGCYITCDDGERYFDCLTHMGVFNLGHRHPEIIQAVTAQMNRMPIHNPLVLSSPMIETAEYIASIAPGKLFVTHFFLNAAHSVDVAMHCARMSTKRTRFIAMQGSFHGSTAGAASASTVSRPRLEPLLDVDFIPYGDAEAFRTVASNQHAAVIFEPVQAGYCRVAPTDYLHTLRQICDELGILMIAEEAQTGLGRTGKLFGVQHSGIDVDMLVLAKGIGGGVVSNGLLLMTEAVMQAVGGAAYETLTTFGGNPLAAVACKATLEVTQRERIPEHVARTGVFFLTELGKLCNDFPSYLKGVSGIGFMVNLMFRNGAGAAWVRNELRTTHKIITGVVSDRDTSEFTWMLLMPPLISTQSDIERILAALRSSLKKFDASVSTAAATV